jgi:phosphatidylglycerophosphate synthase
MSPRSPDRLVPGSRAEADVHVTLTKPSDGIVSRLLNRRISIPISRRLARTPITPNQISVINLLIGIVSAGLAATGEPRQVLWSGVLFQLGSILDGCDGEVAKLTGQATPQGAWVDTLTDNLSYVAYSLGVTVGFYRRVDAPVVLVVGGIATFAIITALVLMYRSLRAHAVSGSLLRFGDAAMKRARQGDDALLKRLIARVEFMIRRDFFALALFNRLDWIFWLIVAGSVGLLVSVVVSYRQVSEELRGPGSRR